MNKVGIVMPGMDVKVEGPFTVHENRFRRPWVTETRNGIYFAECITRISFGTTRTEVRHGVNRLLGGR